MEICAAVAPAACPQRSSGAHALPHLQCVADAGLHLIGRALPGMRGDKRLTLVRAPFPQIAIVEQSLDRLGEGSGVRRRQLERAALAKNRLRTYP